MRTTSRLKILHADTDDLENPLRGGQPVRTFAINSRLAERHDVTVLTSVYKNCRRHLNRGGVRYHRLGFRVPRLGLSPHLSFLAALGPTVAQTPHDLVVEEFTPPVGFCGLPWWTEAPVILMVQWYFFEQWEKRYRLPFTRCMKRLAQSGRYHHVIVQSDAMRRELQPLLPRATFRRIPCGIESTAFARGPQNGEYALFLGRLDMHHKGLDLLLEAWREISAKTKIPLIIAGEGPARRILEESIARLELGSLVRLVGRVEGKAKDELLAQCRLVVMPSRYETFGIAALEAMAAAKPVVCFNIDHLNELASPPWAEQVDILDAKLFGQAVARVWENPQRCLLMGAHAQRQARGYHWDSIAREQEQFYLEVINSRREAA